MIRPVELFAEVLEDFQDDIKWSGALLGKIKTISNTKVGTVGQMFIERLCDELHLPWTVPLNVGGRRATQSPWDIKILGVEFELKTATEDTNKKFQFNHLRYHRPYEAVLCLGVSPADLYFGCWTKAEVSTGKAGKLVSMEKGANASYKLTKGPTELHSIDDFGPTIIEFCNSFQR